MSIQTDLSVSPYFDDYSDLKDFYKILFRPGVSVQVRELNQLQTYLQRQVERLGNNIFKQGTIIDGCDITYHADMKYVKIKDAQTDSTAVDVSKYVGYHVKNQNDVTPLQAAIIEVAAGFETTAPDLNTLFVKYLNSGFKTGGSANGQSVFDDSEKLTVYSPDNVIEKINIQTTSSGFGVNDRVVILSAIAVQNTTGGTTFANNFYVGDYISDGTANVEIVEIDTTTVEDAVVLRIKPRVADLQLGDYSKWSISVNNNIQSSNATPSSFATVISHVGSGAAAVQSISNLGQIDTIEVTQKGSGYSVLPTVSITSPTATQAQLSLFSATAQNYIGEVTVASAANSPTGDSYGITVGDGIIYQKGYFTRVGQQLAIVEKYNNEPDLKSVGFETVESVVGPDEDDSLFDNATGEPNYTAPGARRLKLEPVLTVISKAEADARSDWLYITEFSKGTPYKQNRQTVYNIVSKEIARRTNEGTGSYVTNPFLLATKNANTFAYEAQNFNILIDPGVAVINGNRVETTYNYEAAVQKGTDTRSITNGNISLNYGNYVEINEVGGYFSFKTGDIVDLYPTAGTYKTQNIGSAPSTAGLGTAIGKARIRSIQYDSGIPGTSSCIYRLYLFDISMNTGKNFADVRSIFYDGVTDGIADCVLEDGKAVLRDNNLSSLLYYAGAPAVVNASALSYIYRTVNTHTLTTGGNIVIPVPAPGSETFPYTGQLSTTQERDIIIVPLANTNSTTVIANGTVSTTSATLVASGQANFLTDLEPGDYVYVGTSGYVQVASIANNTYATLMSNAAFDLTANTLVRGYPAYAPISMARAARTITNNGSNDQLTIDINETLGTQVSAAVTYNVRGASITPVTKTVKRNRYVRLCLANNASSNTGPWVIGVPDVFRLNSVYEGANGTFGTAGTDVTDVTQYFYIDHNQNEDYYGLSYLYLKPGVNYSLSTTDWLLVDFDYFTHSGEGIKAPGNSGTYSINDTTELASATSTINTLEIPEVYSTSGNYYDLRDHFDFRPIANAQCTPNTSVLYAPLNPVELTAYSGYFSGNDKKFPAPDSELSTTMYYYQGRTDRVVIDETNTFRVLRGTPGSTEPPEAPTDALTINILKIPPYPSHPFALSAATTLYADTKIANERYSTQRLNNYRIVTPLDASSRITLQPRGYTMQEIGKLERRIADLEYYTSLSLTETIAQKRVLPGFDGTDRFKFGFFVDGFEDYKLSDTNNPAYRATIVDGYLSPLVEEDNIEAEDPTKDPSLPFNEHVLVAQTRATDGPVTANTVTSNTSVTQIIAVHYQFERTSSWHKDGDTYDDYFYIFSSQNGPASLIVAARNYLIGAEVSQSTSADSSTWTAVTSSKIATAASSTDAGYFKYNDIAYSVYNPGTLDSLSTPLGKSWGTWRKHHFKLSWTHNASRGQYYRIRIYKGGSINHWSNSKFAFRLSYPTDTAINTTSSRSISGSWMPYFGLFFPMTSWNFLDVSKQA